MRKILIAIAALLFLCLGTVVLFPDFVVEHIRLPYWEPPMDKGTAQKIALKEAAKAKRNHYAPVAIDLNGDGKISTTKPTLNQVYIDIDADDLAENVGWIAPEDGLLFYDKNQNSKFDGIDELFADPKVNGFVILGVYDYNGDKVIDEKDEIYNKILVWQDKNGNGKVNKDETKSLKDYNITSIPLKYKNDKSSDENGNIIKARGTYKTNDEKRFAASVELACDYGVSSRYVGKTKIDRGMSNSLFLYGFGKVPDTNVAMTLDEDFKDFIEDRVYSFNQEERFIPGEELIYRWSGLYKLHEKYGIKRSYRDLTMWDKIWVVDTFFGDNIYQDLIEENYKNKEDGKVFGDITFNAASVDRAYKWRADYYTPKIVAFAFASGGIEGIKYSYKTHTVEVDGALLEKNLQEHYSDINKKAIMMKHLKKVDDEAIKTLFSDNKTSIYYKIMNSNVISIDDGDSFNIPIEADIQGTDGDDVIIPAGSMKSVINGKKGDDLYIIRMNMGDKIIKDSPDNNTILFIDMLPRYFGIMKIDDNLEITYGTMNRVIMDNSSLTGIEFSDGRFLDAESIDNITAHLEKLSRTKPIFTSVDARYNKDAKKIIMDNLKK